MARVCTVCRHTDRDRIDAALIANSSSLRTLAGSFNVSASALRRHRADHLPATLAKSTSLTAIAKADSLSHYVQELRSQAVALHGRARTAGDLKTELAALRELRALAELEERARQRASDLVEVAVVEMWMRELLGALADVVTAEQLDVVLQRVGKMAPLRPALEMDV